MEGAKNIRPPGAADAIGEAKKRPREGESEPAPGRRRSQTSPTALRTQSALAGSYRYPSTIFFAPAVS